MVRIMMISALVGGAMMTSGCSTLRGAGIGAAGGASVQALRGKDVKDGAVAGAAAGAVIGTIAN